MEENGKNHDKTNIYLSILTRQAAFFCQGSVCVPKICYLLLKANLFPDKKPRFYGCLFAYIKGRKGEPPTAPAGCRWKIQNVLASDGLKRISYISHYVQLLLEWLN